MPPPGICKHILHKIFSERCCGDCQPTGVKALKKTFYESPFYLTQVIQQSNTDVVHHISHNPLMLNNYNLYKLFVLWFLGNDMHENCSCTFFQINATWFDKCICNSIPTSRTNPTHFCSHCKLFCYVITMQSYIYFFRPN